MRGDARRTTLAIRDVRGADKASLTAHLHHLHTLGPARDHAVKGELGGLTALVRAVEHLAVDEGAAIVDLHLVGGLGALAGACLDVAEDQA